MGQTIGDAKPGELVHYEYRRLMLTKDEYKKLQGTGFFESAHGREDSKVRSVTLDGSRVLNQWCGDAPVTRIDENQLSAKECRELAFVKGILSHNLKKSMPFTVFHYEGNRRRYLSVSEAMADALTKANYYDFLYNRMQRTGERKDPCVRLSKGFRLFDWDSSADQGDVKEVQPGDLTIEERAAYHELLNRLVVLGFNYGKKPVAAKEQSFTEALYQDRKAAAVKAAQPVIAKDLEPNKVVDLRTEGDKKAYQDRYMLSCSLLTHCRDMRELFPKLKKVGCLSNEHAEAVKELEEAVAKFYRRGVKT
jgi:hypothetical protein